MLFQQLDRYSIMTKTANNARRCRAARATDGAGMAKGRRDICAARRLPAQRKLRYLVATAAALMVEQTATTG
jgi:hypothetical protein